jgi:predicted TIM-barrel fold metal-dependent hydrolase
MLINAHCHVFTFETFLTSAAETNIKARLMSGKLSEAAANDALKIAKKILFSGNADERIADLAKRYGLEGNPILEFLRRGCRDTISEVTDDLMKDTIAGAGTPDVIVVPLMMDVIEADASSRDLSLYKDQYDQTVQQAVRHPGRVLPFVAVNPLRGPGAHELMVHALDSGECVGVKLYPSLGWEANHPMVDKIMRDCEHYSAPLTMHCNDGGFCGAEQYDYYLCSPISWRDVVRKYDVRFNFAHFGDQTPGKDPVGSATLWRDYIVKLMADYPKCVYADVSYQSGPLGTADEKTAYVAWLKNELASPHGNNILFGTDSFMLLQAMADRDYWQFFKTQLGKTFQRIAEDNPKRFLGLPAAGAEVQPGSAMARHIDFLNRKKAESGSGFGKGSAPAGWLAGRV